MPSEAVIGAFKAHLEKFNFMMSLKDVSKVLNKSGSRIYADMAEGKFPKPIRVGGNDRNGAVRWPQPDILNYFIERIAERDEHAFAAKTSNAA